MSTKEETEALNGISALLSADLFPHFGSVSLAVFNCNDYGKSKGREAVKAKYGDQGWKEVTKRMKSGIMEIFNHKPTKETALFANVVGLAAEKRFASK